MNVDEVVQYWLELAKDDWKVIQEAGEWLKSELKREKK